MTAPLRLVIFDVDGTLVDSQAHILLSMTHAFETLNLPVPGRADILSIVGLSLPHAMARLAPGESAATQDKLVEGYKTGFANLRTLGDVPSPLYPGAAEVLAALNSQPDTLLGVATGKSRRGLDALIESNGWQRLFVTRQTADDHPSKPHPSMIRTAMAEAGVEPEHTVMIGDTSYDMDMARAAGVTGIAVTWGYHPAHRIGGDHRLHAFDELAPLLGRIWGT